MGKKKKKQLKEHNMKYLKKSMKAMDVSKMKFKNNQNPFAFMKNKNIHKSKRIGLCPNAIIDSAYLIRYIWEASTKEKACSGKFILPIKKKIRGTRMIESYEVDNRLFNEIEYFYLITLCTESDFPDLQLIHEPNHKYREALIPFCSSSNANNKTVNVRDLGFFEEVLPKNVLDYTIYRISRGNFKRLIWKLMCSYDGEFVKNDNTPCTSILKPLTSVNGTNFLDEIILGYAVMKNSDVYEIEFQKRLDEIIQS